MQAQRLISTHDDSLSVILKPAGAKAKTVSAPVAAAKPALSCREQRKKKREAETEAAHSSGPSDSDGYSPPIGKRVRVIKKVVKPAAAAAPAAAPRDPAARKMDAFCNHFFSAHGCRAKDACRFRHHLTEKEKAAAMAVNPPPPKKSN